MRRSAAGDVVVSDMPHYNKLAGGAEPIFFGGAGRKPAYSFEPRPKCRGDERPEELP